MKLNWKAVAKPLKWGLGLLVMYGLVTTLYFGHAVINEQKGIYTFYWSGLNGLWTSDKAFGFAWNQPVVTKLEGVDGPYVFDSQVYAVDARHRLISQPIDTARLLAVKVQNPDQDHFWVHLRKEHPLEPDRFPMPTRLMAISDIEGNFDGFWSFLVNNGVMDKHYNWTFGSGHLVLNGDFVDRGKDVTQVLWLIYSLEQKAALAGGKVHYILGNHEIMNLYGDASHADYKYREVAKRISGEKQWDQATKALYSSRSELGKWLRSKNIAEQIGTYLFVHAGLNQQHVAQQLTIRQLNQIARAHYGIYPEKKEQSSPEALVLSAYYSPYWDRSLAMDWLYRAIYLANDPFNAPVHKPDQGEVARILAYYGGQKLVIGHSVMSDITADYAGKVIKLDVKHGHTKRSGQTKGLLVEADTAYKVDDLGRRHRL